MASQNSNGFRSFQASPGISAWLAVDVQSDGTVTPCAGSAARGIGVTQADAAAGDYVSVKLWTAPGTFMIQASGSAITVGTAYSIVTGGYASAVNGTFGPGGLKALESLVASNGIIGEFAVENKWVS